MSKKTTWFVKTRGSYLPNSWQAWVLYIPYTAYLAGLAIYVLNGPYSLWNAVFILVPNWVVALIIMTWIAEQTSKKS
jgi:hypothetical protein